MFLFMPTFFLNAKVQNAAFKGKAQQRKKKSIVRANKWLTISKWLLGQYQAAGSKGEERNERRTEEGRVR